MNLLPFRSTRFKLVLLSIMHFAIDGLCAYLAFAKLYPDNQQMALFVFFGYNILAFVTQSPVGMIIDKYNKPKIFLAISMGAMLLGYIFCNVWFIAVFLIGMGNSIFHVAGGKYVTDKSGNDISHLGIFVSTGAIGLVLGQRYLSFMLLPHFLFALLIICGLLIILSSDSETKPYFDEYDGARNSTLALFAVVGVVIIRSFVGKVVTPGFDLSDHIFLIIAIATALGKALGGVCSKIIGIRITAYVSMIASAICLTLGTNNIFTFVFGIFAFNFTMPITLYYANILLKGSEGFAFGTLAAALTPGFFFAYYFTYSLGMRICTAILCILSMLVIIFVSKRIKNYDTSLDSNNNS